MNYCGFLGQLDKVDPTFLHQTVLLLLGALGGASAVVGILRGFGRQRREIGPQPLEVKAAMEWASAKECVTRHGEVSRRLSQHDDQIRELWNEMRKENQNIRDAMGKWFTDTERALGRIEGKLNSLLKD